MNFLFKKSFDHQDEFLESQQNQRGWEGLTIKKIRVKKQWIGFSTPPFPQKID